MRQLKRPIRKALLLAALAGACAQPQTGAATDPPPSLQLRNGKWFNGRSFESREFYSVAGRLTEKRPAHVDGVLDLSGMWIVPPFGEGHNHNLGTGVEKQNMEAADRYRRDGVLYVRLQGSTWPLSPEENQRLGINVPGGIDAIYARTFTSSGGHPTVLMQRLFEQGFFPGLSKEGFEHTVRTVTVDSEAELDGKWPGVLGTHPDFIKTILALSDEFEKRKANPQYVGQRGLDPRLLSKIVARAHQAHLRVSTHASNAADFHNALVAGADEIAHVPYLGDCRIDANDAALAADWGLVVDTTANVVRRLPPTSLPPEKVPAQLEAVKANLRLLHASGVTLAVGSDNFEDSSLSEIEFLKGLNVFDNLTLLKMWSETTPRTIFPGRKIGELNEGFEASFLALEGNPIDDLENLRKIKFRVKQGYVLKLIRE